MTSEEIQPYLDVARNVARAVGTFLRQQQGTLQREQIHPKGAFDFVTRVDTQAENMIVEQLLGAFPDHEILAEEQGQSAQKSSFRWIIDPLDGTKNYMHNIPYYCLSIALQIEGKIVAGLVFDPVHDELFEAIQGGGAFCNGRPIRVNPDTELARLMLATGFPHRNRRQLPAYLLAFEELFLRVAGIRRCGAAALDLCYTACGRFGGFFELGLNLWDIAAGALMVQQAGGVVTDFWGEPNFWKSGYIIAGNATTHQLMQKILSVHFQKEPDT